VSVPRRAPAPRPSAGYDPIAWYFDRHWSSHYHPWAIAVLERLLLPRLPAAARVLDLCCGTGVVAGELGRRGYVVTGVDLSGAMLRHARANAPRAALVQADVRRLLLRPRFHAAVSTFDSLNHILSPAELLAVFRNARGALRPGGLLAFDLNLEPRYTRDWRASGCTVDDQHAGFVRGEYDPGTRIGWTWITLFTRGRGWERRDVTLAQRYHPPGDVLRLLAEAGFAEPRRVDVPAELGVPGGFGEGRCFFVAERGPAPPGAQPSGRRAQHGPEAARV
jgi:SAM-dependent methyltransferase